MVSEPPTPQQNRFNDMEYEDSSASLGHIVVVSAVYGTADEGNECYNVNKITKYFKTYPCSLRMITKLTIDDTRYRLGGIYEVNPGKESISYTCATHDMDPNYGSFLSYHKYSSGEYVTIGNR